MFIMFIPVLSIVTKHLSRWVYRHRGHLLLSLVILHACLFFTAQITVYQIQPVTVDPSGSCTSVASFQFNTLNGDFSGCVAGTWTVMISGSTYAPYVWTSTVTPEAFGAKGNDDGTCIGNDDAPAITSALAAIPANGGTVRFKPSHIYSIYSNVLVSQRNVTFISENSWPYVLGQTGPTYINFCGTTTDGVTATGQNLVLNGVGVQYPINTGGPLTDPSSAPTASISGSGTLNGTYYASYSWATADGRTLPSPQTTVAGFTGSQGISITVPSCPPGASGYFLYLAQTSAGTDYQQESTPLACSNLTTVLTSRSNAASSLRPLINTTGACAVRGTAGIIVENTTIQIGNGASVGLANGICNPSGTRVHNVRVVGGNICILNSNFTNGVQSGNNLVIDGSTGTDRCAYGTVSEGGNGVSISGESGGGFNTTVGIWIISGTGININSNYFEQDSPPATVLQLGINNSAVGPPGSGLYYQPPTGVTVSGNYITCTAQSGVPPINIQGVYGLDFTSNSVSNCANQSEVITNPYATASANIRLQDNINRDLTLAAWIDNTTGVIYNNSALAAGVLATPTIPALAVTNTLTVGGSNVLTSGGLTASYTPFWLRFFGDGSAGALNVTSGTTNLNGEYWYSSINVSSGATVSTSTGFRPLILRSTGTCTIVGTLANSVTVNAGSGITASGDFGGGGGGGGGGTAGGTAGSTLVFNGLSFVSAGSAGAITGGNGGNGNALASVNLYYPLLSSGMPYFLGGSFGGAGGSTGGAAGKGGGVIILVCPTINFTGTMTVAGGNGTNSPGNAQGSGGGGGGGYIITAAQTYTANTGTYTVSGGTGGSCSSFTTCGTGGNGANGWSKSFTIQ